MQDHEDDAETGASFPPIQGGNAKKGRTGQASEKKTEWGSCTCIKVHQCTLPF